MDDSLKKPIPSSIESGSRWVQEEWRSFELYEKKRVRDRRKKALFIGITLVLFLGLCSIPVIHERAPKWQTLAIARNLAVEVEKLKTLAIKKKQAARLVFVEPNLLTVELVTHCGIVDEHSPVHLAGQSLVTKQWTPTEGVYKILTPELAKQFSIALVEPELCFDPVLGMVSKHNKVVIAIVPVNDLAEQRLDRASYVIIDGDSATVTLN